MLAKSMGVKMKTHELEQIINTIKNDIKYYQRVETTLRHHIQKLKEYGSTSPAIELIYERAVNVLIAMNSLKLQSEAMLPKEG
jgi:hypothetical protein